MLGLPAADAGRERLFGMVADRLVAGSAPALWVVDDLSATLTDEEFHDLIIPAGTRVRTVVTTDGQAYTGSAGLVRLDTMTRQDARLLLSGGDDGGDAAVLDRIGAAAGWHARSLALHAEALRSLGGPEGMAEYAARVEADPPPAARLVSQFVEALAPEQREILRLVSECAPAPLPAGLLAAATGLPEETVTAALADLGGRLLATRIGSHWQISPLVRPAGRDPAMADAAARAVLDRWEPAVLPHAAELADRTGFGPELLRRLVPLHVHGRHGDGRAPAGAAAAGRRGPHPARGGGLPARWGRGSRRGTGRAVRCGPDPGRGARRAGPVRRGGCAVGGAPRRRGPGSRAAPPRRLAEAARLAEELLLGASAEEARAKRRTRRSRCCGWSSRGSSSPGTRSAGPGAPPNSSSGTTRARDGLSTTASPRRGRSSPRPCSRRSSPSSARTGPGGRRPKHGSATSATGTSASTGGRIRRR